MFNSRELSLLRPDVEANCRILLERCKNAGLQVLVTNTVRDDEYQAYLYEQGRTRPGGIITNGRLPTFHSDKAGLAFDICKNSKGQEYNDNAFFAAVASIAKKIGFSWGGDWKSISDKPHFQWDCGGKYGNRDIRAGNYPPPMPIAKSAQTEEEEMTQEQFNRMAESYLMGLAEHQPGNWSAAARTWAEQNDIIEGNAEGDLQYKAFCTREQMVVFLKRFADNLGKKD